MLKRNSAEGGTTTVAVTGGVGGNSGGSSVDYFDAVTIAGGSAVTFDSTNARGSMAYLFTPTSGNPCYLEWSTQMGTVTTVYGRFYVWLSASPAAATLIQFRSGSTNTARMVLNATPTFNWKDSAGTDIALTTTATLTTQIWYRVEYKIIFSTTVGQVIYSYYLGDGTTPVETLTAVAVVNFGAANSDTFRIGRTTGVANTYTVWMDEIVLNDTGLPGPATLATPTVPRLSPATARAAVR